jgi:hypothetical protein
MECSGLFLLRRARQRKIGVVAEAQLDRAQHPPVCEASAGEKKPRLVST